MAKVKFSTISQEKSWRSLIKAISWRVTGSVDTFILAAIFTGSLKISAAIGATEIFTKIILYYLHERFWNRISIGREKNESVEASS
ncbi:MAG: DUF2061 domain-containing protein [Alphaproteobacteria bacterium]